MNTLREYRLREQSLADLLLYQSLIADGVLLQNDGSLLAAWRYRGPDLDAATHAEMSALSARLNGALKLGGGWMIQTDAIRYVSPSYVRSEFAQPTLALIETERCQQYAQVGAQFETDYFLTLTYMPPVAAEERLRGFLFDGDRGAFSPASQALKTFSERVDGFEKRLQGILKTERLLRVVQVDDVDFERVEEPLLGFLRRCVTTEEFPFAAPAVLSHLAPLIGTRDLYGGIAPKVGEQHLRMVAVESFPQLSVPAILAEMDRLPIAYRWSTRAILLDGYEAKQLIDGERKKWRGKVRGFKDQIMGSHHGAVDVDAVEMARQAEEAMGVASSGDVEFALYSSVIVVHADSANQADLNAKLVRQKLQAAGFEARIETLNALEAWRGSLPGDGYRNVRRVYLHTLNLADLLPTTSVYAGEKTNPSQLMPADSAPLFLASTAGATPYRFHFHYQDVGHSLCVGPTGAGKSTYIGLCVAQWFRYPNAQVFCFDKGYALEVLTRASGGAHYALMGTQSQHAFCPLLKLDDAADIAFAVEWLEALAVLQNMAWTPGHSERAMQALNAFRSTPPQMRSLTHFRAQVQDTEIREALSFYCVDGPMGSLLDAIDDSLDTGRFAVFEMEHLMHLGAKAVVPVLLYLFRQVERRLDGSPTLVTLDEAWVFLSHPLFQKRIKEWLKTLRKKNAAVLLATQNLADIVESEIASAVLDNTFTKVLLPNAEASNPGAAALYTQLGLNPRELQQLQLATPKRHYYVISPYGRRMVSLGLGPVALSFVGAASDPERRDARALEERFGNDWPTHWLRARGQGDWATYLDQLKAST